MPVKLSVLRTCSACFRERCRLPADGQANGAGTRLRHVFCGCFDSTDWTSSPVRQASERITASGSVKPTAPSGNRGGVGALDAPPAQASIAVSLLQLVARGDPAGGADVCALPLSLRNVEDLLFERGIDICHETIRLWWNRFGPLLAGDTSAGDDSLNRGVLGVPRSFSHMVE